MEVLPDWVTLRIYLTAIELGSIRQAADRCGNAVAAAAKRIQMPESDSALALFERGARGVRPTAAGEALAQHARALFDLGDRLTANIRGFASGSLGKVRLSVTSLGQQRQVAVSVRVIRTPPVYKNQIAAVSTLFCSDRG
jgi:DNA-binding transcriptional LysR family regulator